MTELAESLPTSEIMRQRAIDAHEIALMLLVKAGEMNIITVRETSEKVEGNTYGNVVNTKIELAKREDGSVDVISTYSTGNQEETFNETQKVVYQTKLGANGLILATKTENGVPIEEIKPGQTIEDPESDIATHLSSLRQNLFDILKEKIELLERKERELFDKEGGQTVGSSAPPKFQMPSEN